MCCCHHLLNQCKKIDDKSCVGREEEDEILEYCTKQVQHIRDHQQKQFWANKLSDAGQHLITSLQINPTQKPKYLRDSLL